jgi:hypothetical protein
LQFSGSSANGLAASMQSFFRLAAAILFRAASTARPLTGNKDLAKFFCAGTRVTDSRTLPDILGLVGSSVSAFALSRRLYTASFYGIGEKLCTPNAHREFKKAIRSSFCSVVKFI